MSRRPAISSKKKSHLAAEVLGAFMKCLLRSFLWIFVARKILLFKLCYLRWKQYLQATISDSNRKIVDISEISRFLMYFHYKKIIVKYWKMANKVIDSLYHVNEMIKFWCNGIVTENMSWFKFHAQGKSSLRDMQLLLHVGKCSMGNIFRVCHISQLISQVFKQVKYKANIRNKKNFCQYCTGQRAITTLLLNTC